MHRQGVLMLSCFLICAACNPYGSKRMPIDNSVYLQQTQSAEATAQTTSKDPNEPSIINLQPEQEVVFTDVLPDNNAKEVPDLASGKNVKIYKQPKTRIAKSNKSNKSKFIKIKPAKPGSKAAIKPAKNPHGNVVSEDITSNVTQRQSNQKQNSVPQNVEPENTVQQNADVQNADDFVPLSNTPAKTYTDQEQKAVLANKQFDQQAVSDRADQLQPPQVGSGQVDQMPKAASSLQPLPTQAVPSGLDKSSQPKQVPAAQADTSAAAQADTSASDNSKLSSSTQPSPSSFELMKTLANQKKPMNAQQEAQLEAQLGKEINQTLDKAIVEFNDPLNQQKAAQNLRKALASNASSNKQPSNTSGPVLTDSTTARNTPPALSAAPDSMQPTTPPEKAGYDLKSKPIPQF